MIKLFYLITFIFMVSCSEQNKTIEQVAPISKKPIEVIPLPPIPPIPTSIPDKIIVKVLFGDLVDSTVTIYRYPEIDKPVYSRKLPPKTASVLSELSIKSENLFDINALYLIKITGGESQNIYLKKSNFVAIKNKGKLRAIVSGRSLAYGSVSVSVYSELLYQRLRYLLQIRNQQQNIISNLNTFTLALISKDLNQDRIINYNDILSIPNYQTVYTIASSNYFIRSWHELINGWSSLGDAISATEEILAENAVAETELIEKYQLLDIMTSRMSLDNIRTYKALEDPAIIKTVDTSGSYNRLYVDKNLLYTCTLEGHLLIYDTSNKKTSPDLIADFETNSNTSSIKKFGNIIIIDSTDNELIFINVSNPKLPKLINKIQLDSQIYDYHIIKQNILVSLEGEKLVLISLNKNKASTIINKFNLKKGNIKKISLYKNYIYLMMEDEKGVLITELKSNELKIIKPILKNDKITNIYIYNNYLYTSTWDEMKQISRIYKLDKNGRPKRVREIYLLDGAPTEYYERNNKLYISSNLLHIYDIKNKNKPRYLGAIQTHIEDFAISDQFIYIAGMRWGLNIIPNE